MEKIYFVVEKNTTTTKEIVEALSGGEFINTTRIINLLKKKGIERIDIEIYNEKDFMKMLNNCNDCLFNRAVGVGRVYV